MEKYNPRFLSLQHYSSFIFGPRGTGKSTFLKHQFSNAITFDLRTSEHFRLLNANPDLLIEIAKDLYQNKTIIIDEIQRIPGLLPVIHKIIEADKSIQFIMTGSRARKLKKQGIDLLAGRAMRKEMHPYILSELGDNMIALDQL